MTRTVSWVHQHRMTAFFVLAYLVAWAPWPFYEAGVLPEPMFVAGGPLVAALVVIGLTDGRVGYRQLLSRLLRWRVGWGWYLVALGFPALLVLATGLVTSWSGAPSPDFSGIVWTEVALLLAIRLVNPVEGALGEEPGWRGWALPRLQSRHSPVAAAALLGVLVAGWHVPLVAFDMLSPVGLPSTVAITFLYVWLFNRTDGSLLLVLLFHASQGAFTYGMLGFTGADLRRADVAYLVVVVVAAVATVVLDRAAWRTAAPAGVESVERDAAVGLTR
jgi:membrane protease YdiL (CAAX protease family)